MKFIFFAAILLLLQNVAIAQSLWTASIAVLDAKSNKNLNMGIAANLRRGKCFIIENGKLELQYDKQMLSDTLFIDVLGYQKYKIRYAELVKQGKALLSARQNPIVLEKSEVRKKETLNSYDTKHVYHWIGFPITDQPFRYLQVGQIFTNNRNGGQLGKIRLNQMVFDLPINNIYDDGSIAVGSTDVPVSYADYPNSVIFQIGVQKGYMHSYTAQDLQSNKFGLRVYHLDVMNQPIAELAKVPIVIDKNPPVENMSIDLSKYKILLPEGKFMVAVEWMPLAKNVNYVMSVKNIYDMSQSLRPFIGVSEKKGDTLNVMALDYGGNWKPFDYLSPYYTDLAMECEISY